MEQSDYELEQHGRLTDPMVYDALLDRYVPIGWDEAFDLIARHLKALDDPDRAAFYTSGRASNEAAFLFQLFVRMYGTNNFPDCSNMCHEATSRGLPGTVGVGKGTVTMDDFEHADTSSDLRPEPGHQPSADARRTARVRQARRDHRVDQPAQGTRPRAFRQPAAPGRNADHGQHQDQLRVHSPDGGRRLRADQGRRQARDRTGRRGPRERRRTRARRGIYRRAYGRASTSFADDLRAESWDTIIAESGVPMDDVLKLADIYVKGKARHLHLGHGPHAAQEFGADDPDPRRT